VTPFTAQLSLRTYLNLKKSGREVARNLGEDPTMTREKRSILMTAAFAVTVAAGLTGLSMSAQTKESHLDQACAHATWPMIPSQCLTGEDAGRTVRDVATRTAVAAPETISDRFAFAFN
jgi:hypothetical protein